MSGSSTENNMVLSLMPLDGLQCKLDTRLSYYHSIALAVVASLLYPAVAAAAGMPQENQQQQQQQPGLVLL